MKAAGRRPPLAQRAIRAWSTLGPQYLPFADAASADLPLPRLLRLSLFKFTLGMTLALMLGTLNRVMIFELQVSAWLVSLMLALPLLVAPFRAITGFQSDTHRSALGWKRVPFMWGGTLVQFFGLAIMPFALLVLSGGGAVPTPPWVGQAAAALSFLMIGAGLQTSQTAGLALATDITPEKDQPRVVALLYVMLLLGMVVASLSYGAMLRHFDKVVLIQVIQGAAEVTMLLNIFAVWKQEVRGSAPTKKPEIARPPFLVAWRQFVHDCPQLLRLLAAIGIGTFAFTLQDVLLEPFGGQVLDLGVAATTLLTGIMASGAIASFAIAARRAERGADPIRLGGAGAVIGMFGFASIILAAPMAAPALLMIGALLIGFGNGLFSIGTLLRVMALPHKGEHGLALGAWGAVQATAAGLAMAVAGGIRDGVTSVMATEQGVLGAATPGAGYVAAYLVAVAGLLVLLVVLGPLAARSRAEVRPVPFGIAEFPA